MNFFLSELKQKKKSEPTSLLVVRLCVCVCVCVFVFVAACLYSRDSGQDVEPIRWTPCNEDCDSTAQSVICSGLSRSRNGSKTFVCLFVCLFVSMAVKRIHTKVVEGPLLQPGLLTLPAAAKKTALRDYNHARRTPLLTHTHTHTRSTFLFRLFADTFEGRESGCEHHIRQTVISLEQPAPSLPLLIFLLMEEICCHINLITVSCTKKRKEKTSCRGSKNSRHNAF